MPSATTHPEIVEVSEGLDEDQISLSRWTDYGKDRLYINHDGRQSHDNVFVDLDGEEGHSSWSRASFEVDGDRVRVEFDIGWDGNWTEHHFEVEL